MTQTQRDQLDKAIKRALAYGIVVTGTGRRKSDGAPIFGTTSRNDPNRWHIVTLIGNRLYCDCAASQYGHVICVHRAAVHMELKVAAAKRQTRQEAIERTLRTETTSRPKQQRPAHETAPLYRDNRPISIFK